LNVGLGDNPRPQLQNWWPWIAAPAIGKYHLTHSIPLQVADSNAPRDGKDTVWTTGKLTSGNVEFEISERVAVSGRSNRVVVAGQQGAKKDIDVSASDNSSRALTTDNRLSKTDDDKEAVAGPDAAVLMLPAKHKEVAISFNGGTALFDLDTGNKLGAMARGVPSDAPQFDLFATWRGPSQTQLNAQVRKLLRVDDGQWVTATAESISEALMQQADAKPKEQQVLANPDNPTST